MKVPTVAKAILYIRTSIHLVEKYFIFKTTEENYILPVKHLIEGLLRDDPPPISQLALPISVPNKCCSRVILSKSPYMQATGDLIIIDFNYLLLCGE